MAVLGANIKKNIAKISMKLSSPYSPLISEIERDKKSENKTMPPT